MIWTDVIQFGLFIFGGALALFMLVYHLGWSEIVSLNQIEVKGLPFDKMRMIDLTTPFEDPTLRYTMWVALFAMPFQNFTAFGVDQLNTQRMFCCSSEKEAKKAMCWSSVSILITVLMMAVGAGLYAWYQVNVPPAEIAESFKKTNNVFPTWITMELPIGVSGLILAGAFAAAISSLDSILAALSQTSLSVIFGREKLESIGESKQMVKLSRVAVCVWGIILTVAALIMWMIYDKNPDSDLIGLAFGMVAYTYGPILGILLAALLPYKSSITGLVIGTFLSILMVAWFRPELPIILESLDSLSLDINFSKVAESIVNSRPQLSSVWFFPINASLTLFTALLLGGLKRRD